MPQKINDPSQRLAAQSSSADPASPVRQCCVTRERLPQTQMIRFVRSPQGQAVPDLAAKLPGRGAWIRAHRPVLETAMRTGALSRAFKAKTDMPEGFAGLIEQQLSARCIGLIGMARKSGQAICGYDQVRSSLKKTSPGWLLTAQDSAQAGRQKIHALAQALYNDIEAAGMLSSVELGMAFGRPTVIHALLSKGRLAETFGIAYTRLSGFRSVPETGWLKDRPRHSDTDPNRSVRQKD